MQQSRTTVATEALASLIYIVLTVLVLGLAYPAVVWGISEVCFHDQAEGSFISRDGKIIAARYIGQNFTSARYFHGRPSAAGTGYDPTLSGGTNLGETSEKLYKANQAAIKAARGENTVASIPADFIAASASGTDPDISPASAEFQARRVADARGISIESVLETIQATEQERTFGFLGEPRVNVVALNLALDDERSVSNGH